MYALYRLKYKVARVTFWQIIRKMARIKHFGMAWNNFVTMADEVVEILGLVLRIRGQTMIIVLANNNDTWSKDLQIL